MAVKKSGAGCADGMILLAEDEAFLRGITKEILEEFGYQVITARDGVEAVKQFNEHQGKFMLAILDVMMPRLSGPEAAKQICAIDPSLPFIFITGFDIENMIVNTEIPQGYRVLQKPTDFKNLGNVVRQQIEASSIIERPPYGYDDNLRKD